MKQSRFLNRIQRRWPRPLKSRVQLAKSDFTFALAIDRCESEVGNGTPPELLALGEDAARTLEQCNVPQSEWVIKYAEN